MAEGHIVRNVDGVQMTTITDSTGLYDFKGLLPGIYRVRVPASAADETFVTRDLAQQRAPTTRRTATRIPPHSRTARMSQTLGGADATDSSTAASCSS